MPAAIQVQGLSKQYRIGKRSSGSLRESLAGWAQGLFGKTQDDVLFRALNEIDFDVQQGEVLGIIGRNGAGKSTLLKILSRITMPTAGRITINGRVASLLEVGTGFHPELTGRENVFMNGAILGMHRAEINRKLEEIIAFSGIEKFIDTPVKRYSSGMYVRLAFAVAAHLEPEILIVDEVLAVGDAEFQKKCLGKMKDVQQHDGRTVLFVSHNMSAVAELCSSALWLEEGRIAAQGTPPRVIDTYIRQAASVLMPEAEKQNGEICFTSVKVMNEQRQSTMVFQFSECILVEMHFADVSAAGPLHTGVAVKDDSGKKLFTTIYPLAAHNKQSGACLLRIPSRTLLQGSYMLDVAIFSDEKVFDYDSGSISFIITDKESDMAKYKAAEAGAMYIPCRWE